MTGSATPGTASSEAPHIAGAHAGYLLMRATCCELICLPRKLDFDTPVRQTRRANHF